VPPRAHDCGAFQGTSLAPAELQHAPGKVAFVARFDPALQPPAYARQKNMIGETCDLLEMSFELATNPVVVTHEMWRQIHPGDYRRNIERKSREKADVIGNSLPNQRLTFKRGWERISWVLHAYVGRRSLTIGDDQSAVLAVAPAERDPDEVLVLADASCDAVVASAKSVNGNAVTRLVRLSRVPFSRSKQSWKKLAEAALICSS
jgi:hypothetical protein